MSGQNLKSLALQEAPALIESSLYRGGMTLQPWQQGVVTECLRHYHDHGQVRPRLAEEVGLGKTLSLGTVALTLCLLDEQAAGNGSYQPA